MSGATKLCRSSTNSLLPEHAEKIIRRRAYQLYEEHGHQDGHAEEDWLHAEAEVLGTVLRRGVTELELCNVHSWEAKGHGRRFLD
jgi:hypothetical protein